MVSQKRKILVAGAVALAAALFLIVGRAPATNESAFDGEPEVIAATFSSAWCSACMILKPRLAKAIPAFAGSPVKFVDYDLTFGERPEIRQAAAADGLAALYDQYSGATGFTLLVDAETGAIIDMLTINHSSQAMRAAIADALRKASPPATNNPYKDS